MIFLLNTALATVCLGHAIKEKPPITNIMGFSLLELLATLAIIGILLGLAYPNYSHYIVKSRRAQAQTVLWRLAGKASQYYAIHQRYQGIDLSQLGEADALNDPFYQFTIRVDANGYLLEAIPQSTQAQQDLACGTLTLNQSGQQGQSGTDNCWPTA